MLGPVELLQRRFWAQAHARPAADAVDVLIAKKVCGSVARPVAEALAGNVRGFRLGANSLELDDRGLDSAGRSSRLDEAARWLLQAGFVRAWRNEKIEVRHEPHSPVLAQIDRCAVRVLGITTWSVHLNGYTADGQLVVGRRAAHKRVDPGLWDNLAGGIVAAGESLRDALVREAHEEAGLELQGLLVQEGARILVRRPICEGTLSERVHVFDVHLPPGTRPLNRDGEVERFETRPIALVLASIERGEFTVEAALATLDSLKRRGHK